MQSHLCNIGLLGKGLSWGSLFFLIYFNLLQCESTHSYMIPSVLFISQSALIWLNLSYCVAIYLLSVSLFLWESAWFGAKSFVLCYSICVGIQSCGCCQPVCANGQSVYCYAVWFGCVQSCLFNVSLFLCIEFCPIPVSLLLCKRSASFCLLGFTPCKSARFNTIWFI